MTGTNGRPPRRWYHRLGWPRPEGSFQTCEISDTATVAVGVSERGVAVEACAFMHSEKQFAHACVYMTADEAIDFANRIHACAMQARFTDAQAALGIRAGEAEHLVHEMDKLGRAEAGA